MGQVAAGTLLRGMSIMQRSPWGWRNWVELCHSKGAADSSSGDL